LWIVAALVLLVGSLVAWGQYQKWQFSAARLVGQSATQVLTDLGPPSWAMVRSADPNTAEDTRIFDAEAIRIVVNGGSGDFIYHRWPVTRYCVHFKDGVATGIDDASR
jgi:hypothetical protein